MQACVEPSATRCVRIRGGVVPFFVDQINRFKRVKLADKRMTHCFLTLAQAIHFLLSPRLGDRPSQNLGRAVNALWLVLVTDPV